MAAIEGDLHQDRAVVDIDDGVSGDRAEASGRRLYRARYRDGWMTQVTVEADVVPAARRCGTSRSANQTRSRRP